MRSSVVHVGSGFPLRAPPGVASSPLSTAISSDRQSSPKVWADGFVESVPVPDRQALIRASLVRSRAQLLRGSAADGEAAARHGLRLAATSDLILDRATALLTLAEALDARDRREAATDARGQAVTLLRDKDHTGAIARLVG
jgi:hypothetical protein